MTLTELRYIAVLAQEQHFGRAAAICGVSQPSLSVAIKKLEHDLGVTLFERTKTRVRLTDLGRGIAAKASALLDQVALMRATAEASKHPLASPLALGALYTLGPYLFPQLVAHLHKQAPAMALYVEENDTANLRDKLCSGALDAIVVALPFSAPDTLSQAVFDETFMVLMSKAHPLAAKAQLAPDDLGGYNLLRVSDGQHGAAPGPGGGWAATKAQAFEAASALHFDVASARSFEAARTAPTLAIGASNSLECLRAMVAADLGIAILPFSAAMASLSASNTLVARPYRAPARTLALAWRASFPRPKTIEILRQAIQRCSGAYWNFVTEPEPGEQPMLESAPW